MDLKRQLWYYFFFSIVTTTLTAVVFFLANVQPVTGSTWCPPNRPLLITGVLPQIPTTFCLTITDYGSETTTDQGALVRLLWLNFTNACLSVLIDERVAAPTLPLILTLQWTDINAPQNGAQVTLLIRNQILNAYPLIVNVSTASVGMLPRPYIMFSNIRGRGALFVSHRVLASPNPTLRFDRIALNLSYAVMQTNTWRSFLINSTISLLLPSSPTTAVVARNLTLIVSNSNFMPFETSFSTLQALTFRVFPETDFDQATLLMDYSSRILFHNCSVTGMGFFSTRNVSVVLQGGSQWQGTALRLNNARDESLFYFDRSLTLTNRTTVFLQNISGYAFMYGVCVVESFHVESGSIFLAVNITWFTPSFFLIAVSDLEISHNSSLIVDLFDGQNEVFYGLMNVFVSSGSTFYFVDIQSNDHMTVDGEIIVSSNSAVRLERFSLVFITSSRSWIFSFGGRVVVTDYSSVALVGNSVITGRATNYINFGGGLDISEHSIVQVTGIQLATSNLVNTGLIIQKAIVTNASVLELSDSIFMVSNMALSVSATVNVSRGSVLYISNISVQSSGNRLALNVNQGVALGDRSWAVLQYSRFVTNSTPNCMNLTMVEDVASASTSVLDNTCVTVQMTCFGNTLRFLKEGMLNDRNNLCNGNQELPLPAGPHVRMLPGGTCSADADCFAPNTNSWITPTSVVRRGRVTCEDCSCRERRTLTSPCLPAAPLCPGDHYTPSQSWSRGSPSLDPTSSDSTSRSDTQSASSSVSPTASQSLSSPPSVSMTKSSSPSTSVSETSSRGSLSGTRSTKSPSRSRSTNHSLSATCPRTRSHTVALVERPSQQTTLTESAQSVASGALVVAVVTPSVVTASTLSRVATMQSLLNCTLSFDVEDIASNLLQITFGPEDGNDARGAIVGNVILVIGFLLVMLGAALLVFCVTPLSFEESTILVHMPSIAAAPIAAILQPTLTCAVALLYVREWGGDIPLSLVTIGLLGLLYPAYLLYHVFYRFSCERIRSQEWDLYMREKDANETLWSRFWFRVSHNEYEWVVPTAEEHVYEEQHLAPVNLGSDDGVVRDPETAAQWKSATQPPTRPHLSSDEIWHQRFLLLFDENTVKWYIVADTLSAVLLGLVSGVPKLNRDVCLFQASFVLFVYGASVALFAFVRPMSSPTLLGYSVLVNVAGMIAAAALVFYTADPVQFDTGADVLAIMTLIISVISMIKSFIDLFALVLLLLSFVKRVIRHRQGIGPPLTLQAMKFRHVLPPSAGVAESEMISLAKLDELENENVSLSEPPIPEDDSSPLLPPSSSSAGPTDVPPAEADTAPRVAEAAPASTKQTLPPLPTQGESLPVVELAAQDLDDEMIAADDHERVALEAIKKRSEQKQLASELDQFFAFVGKPPQTADTVPTLNAPLDASQPGSDTKQADVMDSVRDDVVAEDPLVDNSTLHQQSPVSADSQPSANEEEGRPLLEI